MFNWFIDLAYFFEDVPDILYLFLGSAIAFFLLINSIEREKIQALEEKAKNYEKVQDFIEYLFRDKRDLRRQVRDYLGKNKFDEVVKKEKEDIDDFMNIL